MGQHFGRLTITPSECCPPMRGPTGNFWTVCSSPGLDRPEHTANAQTQKEPVTPMLQFAGVRVSSRASAFQFVVLQPMCEGRSTGKIKIELFLGDWYGPETDRKPMADRPHSVRKPIFDKRARIPFFNSINNYTIRIYRTAPFQP
jgi:hypothetical protein